jgi:hypothetical protein
VLTEAVGIVGLRPSEFWELTWADYDDLLFNVRYREQQALVGPRMVATQLYNIAQGFAKSPKAKTESAYRPLHLVDPEVIPSKPLPESWWQRMEALARKAGKRFAPIKD